MEGRNEAKLETQREGLRAAGVVNERPGFKSIMYKKQKEIYEKYESIQKYNDSQRVSDNVQRDVKTLYTLDYRDTATKQTL